MTSHTRQRHCPHCETRVAHSETNAETGWKRVRCLECGRRETVQPHGVMA